MDLDGMTRLMGSINQLYCVEVIVETCFRVFNFRSDYKNIKI